MEEDGAILVDESQDEQKKGLGNNDIGAGDRWNTVVMLWSRRRFIPEHARDGYTRDT